MDLKAYAEQAGKDRSTLARKVMAWRVLDVCHVAHKKKATDALMENRYGNGDEGEIYREIFTQVKNSDFEGRYKHLYEIHAAPHWLWVALVKQMIESGWTVQVTRDKVGAFKEVADPGR